MDPTLEIIRKCMDELKADPEVSSFVQNKIFDRVPEKQDGRPNISSPYISLGNTSLLSEDYDCLDSTIINIQWNVWSWGNDEAYSSAEVRKIAFFIRKCLHKIDVELTENGFVELQHQVTSYNRASDGITNQATLTFECLIDIL